MLNSGYVPGGRGLEDVTARGFDERRSGGRFNGMARAAERRIRKATRFWRVSCRTARACGTPASPLRIRAGASMPVPRLAGDAVAFRQCFIRQYAAVRRAPGEHSGVRRYRSMRVPLRNAALAYAIQANTLIRVARGEVAETAKARFGTRAGQWPSRRAAMRATRHQMHWNARCFVRCI